MLLRCLGPRLMWPSHPKDHKGAILTWAKLEGWQVPRGRP